MSDDSSTSSDGRSFHMDPDAFRRAGHAMVDWIADYHQNAEQYPVLSRVEPGAIRAALPDAAPEAGEAWNQIWSDFQRHIMLGVTHWQSPNFFAYFPANTSYPSILGELLSAGLGVQGMIWSTSPAATELETHVLDWLVDLLGLPTYFKGAGVIQDTASSASLCALLCAREQALQWGGNEQGLASSMPLTAYVSDQAHSSLEKAVKIAGLGRQFLRVIPSNSDLTLDPDALARAIADDIDAGLTPCFVNATFGTTSSLAIDPLRAIGEVCRSHENVWFHVDAAMAGAVLLCPEHRHLADGLELADSFCFNPHKWMFTNFDCDAFYVKDPERLVRTLTILPEYLRAAQANDVINYRDWHIPLGRRFRSLKLWFVLRHYGAEGLRHHVREHLRLAELVEGWIRDDDRFELVSPRTLNLLCFRLRAASDDENQILVDRINQAGHIHLTHTKIHDRYTIRFSIGQTNTQQRHVENAWREITRHAAEVSGSETN